MVRLGPTSHVREARLPVLYSRTSGIAVQLPEVFAQSPLPTAGDRQRHRRDCRTLTSRGHLASSRTRPKFRQCWPGRVLPKPHHCIGSVNGACRFYSRFVICCSRIPHFGHSTIRVQSCGRSRLPLESVLDFGTWTLMTGTTAPHPPQRVVLSPSPIVRKYQGRCKTQMWNLGAK